MKSITIKKGESDSAYKEIQEIGLPYVRKGYIKYHPIEYNMFSQVWADIPMESGLVDFLESLKINPYQKA